jgi:hypothetical protein
MEVTWSSEIPVPTRPAWCHIPEDGIIQELVVFGYQHIMSVIVICTAIVLPILPSTNVGRKTAWGMVTDMRQ